MKKLLLCMVMAACAAHAAKVSSVSVKLADGGEDTGDVLARCMVKAGDEYDPQQCARDVRTLRDTNTSPSRPARPPTVYRWSTSSRARSVSRAR